MIYKAVAEERFDGEAKKYKYEKSKIEKDDYFFEVLKNRQDKTNCIKDIFNEMMKDEHVNKTKPCVKWYKNNDEMLCIVKAL
ncbi:MAG TPA: hypothetical protein VGI61_07755 [Parafilimonas sp.]